MLIELQDTNVRNKYVKVVMLGPGTLPWAQLSPIVTARLLRFMGIASIPTLSFAACAANLVMQRVDCMPSCKYMLRMMIPTGMVCYKHNRVCDMRDAAECVRCMVKQAD